jgi:hypothetical protein
MMRDKKAAAVFDSLVCIKVGDGANTMFWTDQWIRGQAVVDIAPMVFAAVSTQSKNKRTVRDALRNQNWVKDVRGNLDLQGISQCLLLLASVCTLERDPSSPDQFSWPWSSTGQYTARSTYRMLCQGLVKWECAKWIWASGAPLKCRIFAWLALQFRLWTSERRYRHELDDSVAPCYTCLQEMDSASHIFVECVYARQVWLGCLTVLGIDVNIPCAQDSLQNWWKNARGRFRKKEKQGFDALVILITGRLWKQRNARVFNNPRK